MIVSLQQFLKTGTIGNLHLGMTMEEVRQLLGPADDVGGTSRKYPKPSIYVYGSVELFFSRLHPAVCHSIWWYPHRGEFRLSHEFRLTGNEMSEQLLSPGMQREEVEMQLRNAGFLFHGPPFTNGIAPTLVLPSGVTAVFEEDNSLYAVFVGQ